MNIKYDKDVCVCVCVCVVSNSLWPHGLNILPGSSVHGILQVRILEWVDIFFSNDKVKRY